MGWEGGVGIDRVGRRMEWKSRVGEGETGELGGGESGRVGWEGERVEIDKRKSGWEGERVGIGVGRRLVSY